MNTKFLTTIPLLLICGVCLLLGCSKDSDNDPEPPPAALVGNWDALNPEAIGYDSVVVALYDDWRFSSLFVTFYSELVSGHWSLANADSIRASIEMQGGQTLPQPEIAYVGYRAHGDTLSLMIPAELGGPGNVDFLRTP
ncbi:hypothetical protein HZB60_11155 [candidate division KSB1 bacterium]|nr:hypothetical protein [candidate division KSB1 bacterium]